MKTFYLENFTNEHGLPLSIRNSAHAENTEPHTHNYIEIVFIRAGHAIHHLHSMDGSEILSNSIIKGDVFTVLPGEIHSYSDSRMFRNYNLCIGTDLMREMTNDLQNLTYFDTFFSDRRKMEINQLHLTPMDFLIAENLIKRIALLLHSKLETKSRKSSISRIFTAIFLLFVSSLLCSRRAILFIRFSATRKSIGVRWS